MTGTEESLISPITPDWSRERKSVLAWDPGRALLAAIRSYQRFAPSRGPFGRLCKYMAVLRHRFWTVITGAEIPLNCQIGGGLLIPHPNGIVIHPAARIGVNCLILQQVTIGSGTGGAPTLHGHVDIGAGAKLLGGIVVGAHARIGANAVVLSDVPANATAVGIPARMTVPNGGQAPTQALE